MKVLNDLVLIDMDEKEVKSVGGIVLTDGQQEPPTTGVVVGIGTKKLSKSGQIIPFSVQVGDRVLWAKHTGRTTHIDGKEMMLLHDNEIVAIIE